MVPIRIPLVVEHGVVRLLLAIVVQSHPFSHPPPTVTKSLFEKLSICTMGTQCGCRGGSRCFLGVVQYAAYDQREVSIGLKWSEDQSRMPRHHELTRDIYVPDAPLYLVITLSVEDSLISKKIAMMYHRREREVMSGNSAFCMERKGENVCTLGDSCIS